MQRFFSTFPASWPGAGLLLLRAVVGLTLFAQAVAYLNDGQILKFDMLAAAGLALLGGFSLLAGILTPVTSLLVVIGSIAYSLSWIPAPATNFLNTRVAIIDMVAISTAILFLGPGAFSLDARLWGRREIFIPSTQRSAKS